MLVHRRCSPVSRAVHLQHVLEVKSSYFNFSLRISNVRLNFDGSRVRAARVFLLGCFRVLLRAAFLVGTRPTPTYRIERSPSFNDPSLPRRGFGQQFLKLVNQGVLIRTSVLTVEEFSHRLVKEELPRCVLRTGIDRDRTVHLHLSPPSDRPGNHRASRRGFRDTCLFVVIVRCSVFVPISCPAISAT